MCLAGCQLGEYTQIHEHEAYARFVAPLIRFMAKDAPRGRSVVAHIATPFAEPLDL